MEKYDVAVIGGGIAGSVAARFSAEHGFRTLLIERSKTPRNKSCSGIQFVYLEKLVGAKIPREKLCRNELCKVEIITPSGKTLRGQMKMLNFWRSTFDSWLNSVAIKAGADFRDEARLLDFEEDGTGLSLRIQTKEGIWQVCTRYLIAADGLYSRIRKKLRPNDFQKRAHGGSLNYYCVGETSLDPNTLYMVYNREFAPLMFAWAYLKDDQWVIGTGADESPKEYASRFFDYIQKQYRFRGEIVRREGFASSLTGGVYLGEGPLLLAGDAAGLIDLYRGLGMDNAALSARHAVKAIIASEKKGHPAIEYYRKLMRGMVHKLQVNAQKQRMRYGSNEELEASLSPLNILKGGLLMILANRVNAVLPPEKVITLPL
jgi:flavin-dependent dehydrogenase